jgi:hypothetical protein
LGIEPNRIDLLNEIDGLSFDDAYKNIVIGKFDDLYVKFISKGALIQNKQASGRLQDLADVEKLTGP